MVAFLDRLSRNFEDGVRILAELTRQNIDTGEGSAAAKFFRRSMGSVTTTSQPQPVYWSIRSKSLRNQWSQPASYALMDSTISTTESLG